VSNVNQDVIIVGGGLAGLFCALKLSPRRVTLVTAAPLGTGASSAWAQGGIAAPVADGDTPESHARDTVRAGAGIVDAARALSVAREAPERVRDLLSYGVPFDRDLEGRLQVSREAAHSTRRIVRVKGDQAGHAIMQALVSAVQNTPSIKILSGFDVQDLIAESGRVTGVRARDIATGQTVSLTGSAVVLATGGIGALYAVTTNPFEARGTGMAMAARAGALIADAEFVQFHPTAIAIGRDPAPLATEALRGDGATLVNNRGERFMPRVHADAEMAPRDVVARAVFSEIAAGRGAFLDARAAIGSRFSQLFPGVYASCMAAGIDPARDLIPIAPAEHYHMGGIAVDENGRTTLEGLWAAGEVASTGIHGANRLASNSLLEAVVFGGRAAQDINSISPHSVQPAADFDSAPIPEMVPSPALRGLMTKHVGVVRTAAGLTHALTEIAEIDRAARSPAAKNIAVAALMVAAAASQRHESRGAHFRQDLPASDPSQAQRTMMTLAQARTIAAHALDAEPRPLQAR
jgi:L-aspartate oxidase